MTSVLPSWMQQLRLDDVPACLDGTPFATAFEAHFAPPVDVEAEHGPVPTEQPDTHAVLDRLGLTGKPFGRERGCWIASTSEYHGDGAWLVVSARRAQWALHVQQWFFLACSLLGLWNWWLGPLLLG